MSIEGVILQAQIHTAEVKASIGGAEHPHTMIFHVHGFDLVPEMQVRDTVTGQLVEVVYAGIENWRG